MDISQETVAQLSDRVDTLSVVLEQINHKVSSLLECQVICDPKGAVANAPPARVLGLDGSYDHKDVLNDEPFLQIDPYGAAQAFSPEIQVQRLTAQLTAAYNRIAALEEQLLANRA